MTEQKKDKLTPKQELFCKLYATNREYFGNGSQSYFEAYDIDTSKPGAVSAARVSAHDNLRNPKILKRIKELLEVGTLNEANLDKELAFCVEQNAELGVKVRAIDLANKIKGRITEKIEAKVEANVTVSLDDRIKQLEEE